MNDSLYRNETRYQKTVIDGGIRVITEEIPYFKSVSIGVWVLTGSRDEHPNENGISHFIEHLLFKGTERRTAFDIAREIDSVGGSLNAFTGREYTCFYAKVLDKSMPLGIDLLSDIFLHPLLDPRDVEKERMVILQEINAERHVLIKDLSIEAGVFSARESIQRPPHRVNFSCDVESRPPFGSFEKQVLDKMGDPVFVGMLVS